MTERPNTSILLGDYLNEFSGVIYRIFINREARGLPVDEIFNAKTINREEIRQALKDRKVRTVEERYAPQSDQGYRQNDADLLREIESQPEKIEALAKLAAQANACENTAMFNRAYFEARCAVFGNAETVKK